MKYEKLYLLPSCMYYLHSVYSVRVYTPSNLFFCKLYRCPRLSAAITLYYLAQIAPPGSLYLRKGQF